MHILSRNLAILSLLLIQYFWQAECQTVSWMLRGVKVSNNSALTYNYGDTLNLACVGSAPISGIYMAFAINRGSSPAKLVFTVPPEPAMITDPPSTVLHTFTVSDAGTLVYDDYNGIAAGFENFAIIRHQSGMTADLGRDVRYLGVGFLRTADSGTYHCTAIKNDRTTVNYTSGALTITVNTKPGQARSTRHSSVDKLLAYSTMVLSAASFVY